MSLPSGRITGAMTDPGILHVKADSSQTLEDCCELR